MLGAWLAECESMAILRPAAGVLGLLYAMPL